MATVVSSARFMASMSALLTETIEGVATRANVSISEDVTISANLKFAMVDKAHAITSGSSVDLDMWDMANWAVPTDPIRNAVALSGVKGFMIRNITQASGGVLRVGAASSAPWTSLFNGAATATIDIPQGGFMSFSAGSTELAVTDTSNHLLKMAAVGGNITFDIVVFGND